MNLKNINSDILAAQVVAYRILGFDRDRAIACMEELLSRKIAGDTFDYEQYIQEQVNKIPKPKPIEFEKITALSSIRNKLMNMKDQIKV